MEVLAKKENKLNDLYINILIFWIIWIIGSMLMFYNIILSLIFITTILEIVLIMTLKTFSKQKKEVKNNI